MSSTSNTPPDGYFNDLSQPISNGVRHQQTRSPVRGTNGNVEGDDTGAPKPKRIACIICRKRKLKCDGSKPACSTCTRLGHDCSYDEVRRKSGPKRGYVKALEERLKQVETLLKTQEPVTAAEPSYKRQNILNGGGVGVVPIAADFNTTDPALGLNGVDAEAWGFTGGSPQAPLDNMDFPTDLGMGMSLDDNTFSWEMIGLGLEEPLPHQDTIDELHRIYFDKIHPSLPMVHKFRYLAAMNLAPSQRPPVCLRYAMWTQAASVTEKYMELRDHFYQRARKYMELDYVKGHGEHIISVGHAQTHVLLASYEFKMMYFPRAWMSTGSGIRLCQMMSLHKLDGAGLDVKQTLPGPRDWTEREERRRTFWMAFCQDRYASIGTGWPMSIEEKDILTDLPCSDEAYETSKPERSQSLTESLHPAGASKLSAFGGIVLMACLFGRNLIHLHRPDADDRDDDLNGEFWKRHRKLDNILLNTSLSMPSHLKLPNGLGNPNIVFTNMNIHTSTICLHQAAIYKADKNHLPSSISAESKVRCITAANEIASVMRMISHMDLSAMNPFISFCLYVAARVFVQYLKSRPEDSQTGDSLRFLLSAMNALKKKNPLTESFLVQLDVDLEGLGMRDGRFKSLFAYSEDNLGTASANAPIAGGIPKRPGDFSNECIFLARIQDDNDSNPNVDMQNIDFSPPSERSPPERPDWGHAQDQERQNMQRSIQGLVISSAYGTDNMGNSNYSNRNDGSTGTDTGRSPDTSSNHPTPNSTTPSDTRASLHANTANASYEASPESSTNSQRQSRNVNSVAHSTGGGPMSAYFNTHPDYSTTATDYSTTITGLTPNSGAYNLPETPGTFEVPAGWEVNPQQGTGMTPIGEGVFRQLMGLGPMEDPMDIGWTGNSI